MIGGVRMAKEKQERGILNTTIDKEILDDFKNCCKKLGLPMNLLVQSFMQQFVEGDFSLKLGKNNKMNIDFEE